MKESSKGNNLAAWVPSSGADQDAVRKRAYELYVGCGMQDGHDLEDWLYAEQELAARKSRSAAA